MGSYTCMHIYINIYIYVERETYIDKYIHSNTCACFHMYKYIYIYMDIYTHIHTETYKKIYTRVEQKPMCGTAASETGF